MTISSDFHRAEAEWPFIGHIEQEYGLPHNLLYAVGSRETHLHNIIGDKGHGHGIWQLDDRWHPIPTPGLIKTLSCKRGLRPRCFMTFIEFITPGKRR